MKIIKNLMLLGLVLLPVAANAQFEGNVLKCSDETFGKLKAMSSSRLSGGDIMLFTTTHQDLGWLNNIEQSSILFEYLHRHTDGSRVRTYTPGHYIFFYDMMGKPDSTIVSMLADESVLWQENYNDRLKKGGVMPAMLNYEFIWNMAPVENTPVFKEKWNAVEYIENTVTGERIKVNLPKFKYSIADEFFSELNSAWMDKIYPDHGWGGNGGEITDNIFRRKFESSVNAANSVLSEQGMYLASMVNADDSKGRPAVVFNNLSYERDAPVVLKTRFPEGTRNVSVVSSGGQTVESQLKVLSRHADGSVKEAVSGINFNG